MCLFIFICLCGVIEVRKKVVVVVVLFLVVMVGLVGVWLLKDFFKSIVDKVFGFFKREVMLVDGYKGFKFGEGFWIEGEYFWNLDYYV